MKKKRIIRLTESQLTDMIKRTINEITTGNEDNKHYWEKWDEDPEGDDEDIEHMKQMVRNAVERGRIDDSEGYEIENILDSNLEEFVEYGSGGSGWFDKSETSIDYKATLRNIRRYLKDKNQ